MSGRPLHGLEAVWDFPMGVSYTVFKPWLDTGLLGQPKPIPRCTLRLAYVQVSARYANLPEHTYANLRRCAQVCKLGPGWTRYPSRQGIDHAGSILPRAKSRVELV